MDRATRLAQAGRWLRQERARRGFATAKAFADALGIDASLVSNYERGASAPDDERAAQIATVLKMDELVVREHLGLWVPAAGVPTEQDLASVPDEKIVEWAEEIAARYPGDAAIQQSARLLAILVKERNESSTEQEHGGKNQSRKTG